MLKDMLRKAVPVLIAGTALWAQAAGAEPISRASVEAWLAAPPPAQMPAPGTQVAGADLEKLRSLLPPGYFEFIADGNVPLEIEATGDYAPSEEYRAVTEANAGKATLRAEGRNGPRKLDSAVSEILM